MAVIDIAFFLIIIPLAVIFLVLTFIYKGIAWFPFVSAVCWFLLGFFLINKYYTDDTLFEYQYYFGLLSLGIGLVTVFAPMYTRVKDTDIERNAPDDIDIWDDKAMDRHLETRKEREKRELRERR